MYDLIIGLTDQPVRLKYNRDSVMGANLFDLHPVGIRIPAITGIIGDERTGNKSFVPRVCRVRIRTSVRVSSSIRLS
jgi:hypothetical protein